MYLQNCIGICSAKKVHRQCYVDHCLFLFFFSVLLFMASAYPLWYLQTVLFLLLDECLVLYMHQLLHVNDFYFMLIMFYLIIETFHQRLLLLENNLFYETNIQISNSSLLLSLPNKVWETYYPLANEVARGYSNAISWYILSPQESLEPYSFSRSMVKVTG